MPKKETSSGKATKDDYYSLPPKSRAELIDGVIYDMSPAPLRIHQKIIGRIDYAVQKFIEENNGSCEIYVAPFDVELAEDTVVQPDISVICDKEKLTAKGCTGAPDWIIEVTSRNAVHDYVYKLSIYNRCGVKEYWIVNPDTKTVSVYIMTEVFRNDHYSFSDDIPVNIYEGKLKLNLEKLL